MEILESVVRITAERDSSSLERSLVWTLADLLPIHEMEFLRLESKASDLMDVPLSVRKEWPDELQPRLEWLPPRFNRITPDIILETIEKGVPREDVIDQQVRSIFPFSIEGGRAGAFVMLSPISLASEQKVIQGFIKVYLNYLQVLDESEKDKLTGLYNRKLFEDRLPQLLAEQRAHLDDEQPDDPQAERRTELDEARTWIALIDIDHFKQVNDRYGHLIGDEVILLIAQLMQAHFRKVDLLFRYGGEEFLVLLQPVTFDMAKRPLERFREAVEAYEFPGVGRLTVSIGFTEVSETDLVSDRLDRADKALYFAKDHGRNQVCNYEELVQRGELSPAPQTGSVELF